MGMIASLALLLLCGYGVGEIFNHFRLPRLLGMLLTGIALGPFALNWLHGDLLLISQPLRTIALIVILLRAGLGLKWNDLKVVGRAAIMLSFIPCIMEGTIVMIMSRTLLGYSYAEGAMLGFVLAAVSPAVVVPSMLNLKDQGYGEDKQIATLVLAGASVDDVISITLFTLFLNLSVRGEADFLVEILKIPMGICLGIVGGFAAVFLLLKFFKLKLLTNKSTEKLLLLLTCAMLYYELGEWLGIASLLGVMAMGIPISKKDGDLGRNLSRGLGEIWVFAQIILFALVGAAVNLQVSLEVGFLGIAIIFIGLAGRSFGVFLSTLGTNLDVKERIFCAIAYTPKATVQAAIGGLPLAMGVSSGNAILAISVLAILITAPLGAMGIKWSAPRLLNKKGG